MAETTLFFGLLFLSIFISGSTAKDLTKEAGTSVQMEVENKTEFDDFYWKFNGTTILEFRKKKDVEKFGESKDRMEFNNETCMLTLNNLKKTDSGVYEAIASSDKNVPVAKYTLSVGGEKNAASGPYPRLPWSVLSAVLIVTQILNNI